MPPKILIIDDEPDVLEFEALAVIEES